MAITDPNAIEFTNTLRAKAEQIRKAKYEFNALIAEWYGGMNDYFPNETDNMIEDGRDTETQLSGADANSIMTRMIGMHAVVDTDEEMVVIHKACVRTLEVS